MNEAAARHWLAETFDVPRETFVALDDFAAFLTAEAERQNLVSRSTLDQLWSRHIVDSAQLLLHAPEVGAWIDLGSGAGFPGLIIALLRPQPVTLIEQRRLRADFLARAVSALGIEERATIVCANAARVDLPPAAVISARAFAPLDKTLTIGSRFAAQTTRWILPRGRNAKSELEAARASWQGVFRLERSVTDEDAFIVVGEQVLKRGRSGKGASE